MEFSLQSQEDIIRGFSPNYLMTKILEAVDAGAHTSEIRADPLKFLLSGERKEIVVCTGGEGLKVSYTILKEMAVRGDAVAKTIIDKDKFNSISHGRFRPVSLQNRTFTDDELKEMEEDLWVYLERGFGSYDRGNRTLIEILKEGKTYNIGGWDLEVFSVPVENGAYKVLKSNDIFGSEYVLGGERVKIKMFD